MELTRIQYREAPATLLYEAAINGSTATLKTLIQKDKLILNKVSLSSFTETPLHISALLGHLDFTIAVLEKCPKMALEQDSLKRLPLHLAAAEGHTQIVKALLNTDKSSCLARDEDGRIPLHLAAMRGRVDVIQELVAANSESVFEVVDGDTVFHLCIKFNHLEAFKVLVNVIDDYEIINLGNQDGNSVLHLAAMLRQLETLRYLLSLREIKEKSNSSNGKGLTALDMLDECPKDFKTLQIQDFLINKGLSRAANTDLISHKDFQPNVQHQQPSIAQTSTAKNKKWVQKLVQQLHYDVEEIRGALMIVATVIASMSFQATMNPPGGVWQQDFKDESGSIVCTNSTKCEAGTSVLAYTSPRRYQIYVSFNSISFIISLGIIALMVGGFPLKKKVFVWAFAQAINVTVFFLSLSYIFGVLMVTPSWADGKITNITLGIYVILMLVFVVVFIIDFGRIAVWTEKRVRKDWCNSTKIQDKLFWRMSRNEAAQALA